MPKISNNNLNKLKSHYGAPKNSSAPHLIVEALAGTGKTTTLVEGLKVVQGQSPTITPSPQQAAVWDALELSRGAKSVCFVAFNKSIAAELEKRVPEGCRAMTMHKLGLKAIGYNLGFPKLDEDRVSKFVATLMGKTIYEIRKSAELCVVLNHVERLVALCKLNLVETDCDDRQKQNNILDLASQYDIDLNGSAGAVLDLVPRVIERCMEPDGTIDYNDMVWLPVALNLSVFKNELLLVDESQDLNRCQQELARKAGDRIVLCGDSHQAIYAFAGADSRSLRRMQDTLEGTGRSCEVLPLTVTRRCSKAVVREAQKTVPQFEAHEDNLEGSIRYSTMKTYHNQVEDGDMVICRCTAPLVSQCFRFIKMGRRANIVGRDIGQGLVNLINKMKSTTIPELLKKLHMWHTKEVQKENAREFPRSSVIINLEDKVGCIETLAEDVDTVTDLILNINRMFTDEHKASEVRLSTIHKAKGLESKNVFLLEPEGATVPHPSARTAEERQQERNLRYVAQTRAIDTLTYVYD